MRFVYVFLFSLLLVSCASLKINKVSELEALKSNSIIYQLPRTEVQAYFQLEKTSFIPGPYAEYAKTYLEIEPLEQEAFTKWRISKAHLETRSVEDTAHTYSISGNLSCLPASNLDFLFNISANRTEQTKLEQYSDAFNFLPEYSELTVKKLMIEESKTSYKTVVVDSLTKRIPIVNTVLRNKTTEELAKDAAKTLTKLRKRKMRLMTGVDEHLPKAGNLQIMLDAIDQKEQQYLELFFGKTNIEYQKLQVSVIPSEYKKYLLFYFDEEEGFIDNKTKGDPVWLNVEALNPNTGQNINDKYSQKEKMLPYRPLQKVALSIMNYEQNIYESKQGLAQFSKLRYMPLQLLKKTQMQLNPINGTIKVLE